MNNRRKIIGLFIALVVVIGFVVAINPDQKPENIKIGVMLGLTGPYAFVGENMRNGVVLAAEQYNAAHPNDTVELIIENDEFEPKKALTVYQKLIGVDHIDALINMSTPSIGVIYDQVTKLDMPVIQGGEQTFEPIDDNVLQVLPGNIELEKQLGAFIKEKGYKTPVVVYTNNDAMIRFKNAFVGSLGGSPKEFIINADEKDLRTHVLKVSEAKPDVIVLLMFPDSGAQFVRQYAAISKLPQLVFDANAQSGFGEYQKTLNGAEMLNGAYIGTISQNLSQEFKDAYKKRFGAEPGVFSDLGYDGFNLLIDTYDSDGKEWIKNVKESKLIGAAGQIEFDSVGVRLPTVKIVQIQDGKIPVEN